MDQNRCNENEEVHTNLSEASCSQSNANERKQEENENLESKESDERPSQASNESAEIEDDGIEEVLSESVRQERIQEALDLKTKGNLQFKQGEFEEAISHYTIALKVCPKDSSKDLSILFANRGACYINMKENLQAIKDCTSALEQDQYYIKARLRRAQIYEAEDKLEDAYEDYKKVLEQDRSCTVAGEAVMRLPDQIKERNEKLKDEMMGKLKDLGNMVLKPFGLSTENFKMQQDPNTGGYSINFQK